MSPHEVQIVKELTGYTVIVPCQDMAQALTLVANLLENGHAKMEEAPKGPHPYHGTGVSQAIVAIMKSGKKGAVWTPTEIWTALQMTDRKGYPRSNVTAILATLLKTGKVVKGKEGWTLK
jgi:hypothetical protein